VVVIPPRTVAAPDAAIHSRRVLMAKGKKAFGGYSINFKGCKDTMESVFGGSPIGPSDMTKKIWAYVKRKKLAGKR
jgi:hypothetical protein